MSYKYWLKNVSFVIICLFILFQILLSFKPYLGTNKTEEYVYYKRDWIRSNIGEKVKNKENIVVLGDSTITSGFLPNIFDNESSFTNTINLSIVDSDAQKHIYFLKDFIKYNYTPDVIIWNPTVPRSLEYYLNANKNEVFDYYSITDNIQFLLDYYLPALNSEKIKNIFLSVFKNREEMDNVIKDLEKERGTYYWNGNKNQSVGKNFIDNDYNSSKSPKLVGTNSEYKKYLFSFLDLAHQLKIKVFIISPPMMDESSLPLKKIPDIYREMERKYDNVYLSNILTSTYYPSELFFNRGHMNYNGATIYTKDLLNSFIKHTKKQGS